jgi:hypothetical protein
MQAGIMIIDAETHTIVEVNPATARLYNRPKEAILCVGSKSSQQSWLIVLQLNDQTSLCLYGGLEGFFDSAWRRA